MCKSQIQCHACSLSGHYSQECRRKAQGKASQDNGKGQGGKTKWTISINYSNPNLPQPVAIQGPSGQSMPQTPYPQIGQICSFNVSQYGQGSPYLSMALTVEDRTTTKIDEDHIHFGKYHIRPEKIPSMVNSVSNSPKRTRYDGIWALNTF